MKALFGKKPEYRARALRWADKQQVMVKVQANVGG